MREFDQLALGQKLCMLKYRGQFVASVSRGKRVTALYRLNETLVEQTFDKVKGDTKVNSIEYISILKFLPYLSVKSLYDLVG